MKVGPYEVLGLLGRGGMGAVHRARGPDGVLVALKVLNEASTESARARFDRERRVLGELEDARGFVPLLDAGAIETERGTQPWFAMPLLAGGTLRDRLDAGRLPVAEAISIARVLASSMAQAHRLGIIHRDLKPENVLFARPAATGDPGPPLIADLGVAKHFRRGSDEERSVALTHTGALVGTLAYMAPEQIEDSKNVGPAADVWALGAILFECLAGVIPFEGENRFQLIENVVEGRRRSLAALCPEAPAPVVAAVERALSRHPAQRPADAAAFAEALASTGRSPGRAAAPAPRPRSARARALRAAVAVLGAAAIVIATIAAIRAMSGRGPALSGPPAPPPPPASPVTPPAQPGPSFVASVDAQRGRALDLESRGESRRALAEWSRLLDSAAATTATRTEAMGHVRRLGETLPLETAPAVTWRVKVIIARRTRASWKDTAIGEGTPEISLPASEEASIARSLDAWRQNVRAATRGLVEIQTDVETTDEAVRHITSKQLFTCKAIDAPHAGVVDGRFDQLLVYVYLGDTSPGPHGWYLDSFGDRSIAYGSISFVKGEYPRAAGSRELEAFVHLVSKRLVRIQGWPEAFVPVGSRHRAAAGFDCFDDPVDLPSQVALAKHILGEHVTDAMWRSMPARMPVPNAWNAGDVHEWRLAGPFRWHGGPGAGLASLERREETIVWTPGSPRTKLATSADVALHIEKELAGDPDHAVAVAQTWVFVPTAQRAVLLVGSDDGCRVRLDGKVVHVHPESRAYSLDEDVVPVTLPAGWSPIHVTVENRLLVWSLSLRVRGANLEPIEGIRLAADRP